MRNENPVIFRLADIWFVLSETRGINPDEADKILDGYTVSWNLRKDDLNSQSEETIDFLAGLFN